MSRGIEVSFAAVFSASFFLRKILTKERLNKVLSVLRRNFEVMVK